MRTMIPIHVSEQVARDVRIYGTGFAYWTGHDWVRLDPMNVRVSARGHEEARNSDGPICSEEIDDEQKP